MSPTRAASAFTRIGGRELSLEELEQIKQQLESLDSIDVVSDERRELVASQWPHLLLKLPPPKTEQADALSAQPPFQAARLRLGFSDRENETRTTCDNVSREC